MKLIAQALIFIAACQISAAADFSIIATTQGGQQLTGLLKSLHDEEYYLETQFDGVENSLYLPASSIASVHILSIEKAFDNYALLESLLPYLDNSSVYRMLKHLNGATFSPRECFFIISDIRPYLKLPELLRLADETLATIYYNLNLTSNFSEALKDLNAKVTRWNSSARICYLNAQYALSKGDPESAMEWALLPSILHKKESKWSQKCKNLSAEIQQRLDQEL